MFTNVAYLGVPHEDIVDNQFDGAAQRHCDEGQAGKAAGVENGVGEDHYGSADGGETKDGENGHHDGGIITLIEHGDDGFRHGGQAEAHGAGQNHSHA